MRFLIGLDDTDRANSGGTGGLAFKLGKTLEEHTGAQLLEVTRHQLFHSPLITCTTRNSAACLVMDGEKDLLRSFELECRSFLLHNCEAGADAGMALTELATVSGEVMAWGRIAKNQVLSRNEAREVARKNGILASALSGDGSGVIGALAAVGLRAGGEDGRFLWLPGLCELKGVYTLTELLSQCPFGRVETLRGRTPHFDDRIDVGRRAYPIVRGGRSVLLVERSQDPQRCEWKVLDRVHIEQLSE
jgi:hypothetical protein